MNGLARSLARPQDQGDWEQLQETSWTQASQARIRVAIRRGIIRVTPGTDGRIRIVPQPRLAAKAAPSRPAPTPTPSAIRRPLAARPNEVPESAPSQPILAMTAIPNPR